MKTRRIYSKIFLLFIPIIVFLAGVFIQPSDAYARCEVGFVSRKATTDPPEFFDDPNDKRYSDSQRPTYSIKIEAEGCGGVWVTAILEDDNNDDFEESEYKVFIEEDDKTTFQLTWLLGDNQCGGSADECHFDTEIRGADINHFTTDDNSLPIKLYKCDGKCDTPHSPLLNESFFLDDQGNPVPIDSDIDSAAYMQSIQSDPCYDKATKSIKPNCYGLLAPIPLPDATSGDLVLATSIEDLDTANESNALGRWINGIVQVGVAAASLLAVLMIMYAGVQYMLTDVVQVKGSAKDKIKDALVGLLIALGIFIILNTINRSLTRTTIDFSNVEAWDIGFNGDTPEVLNSGTTTAGPQGINCSGGYQPPANLTSNIAAACPDCEQIPASISLSTSGSGIQGTNVSGMSSNQLAKPFLDKMKGLELLFSSSKNGATRWTITEAWPPTRWHCSQAHYTGRTADVALRPHVSTRGGSNYTAQEIKDFIEAAVQSGLFPQYEVKSNSRRNSLRNDPVLRPYIQAFETQYPNAKPLIVTIPHATGEHFSVYYNQARR